MADPLDELRAAVAALPPPPAELAPYLERVRTRAYTLTDDDVAALRAAGFSDDELFEQTVAVAVAEGLRRFDAGLRAVG